MSIWQPGPRPAWVTALNETCDPGWITLDADALAAEAREKTGLDDFGDERFWEPFRIFVDSLNEEQALHTMGALLIRGDLVNALTIRLQLTEERKRHPQVTQEKVDRPIFITGLPRTGTSITHELLAADPRHRAPQHWEIRTPSRHPRLQRTKRIRESSKLIVRSGCGARSCPSTTRCTNSAERSLSKTYR